jgi:ATP-binding cassette subfamily B protein/subfamily B ATP-binding cassette protein MsbA
MQGLFAVLSESFGGVQVVKAYTMERYERRRVRETSKKLYRKAVRITLYSALVKPATEVMGISVICLAMVAGGYLVLSQDTQLLGVTMCDRPLSLGALAAFYALVVGVSDPARKLSDVMANLQQAAAAADRVLPLLDRRPQVFDPPHPLPLPAPHRELSFEGVSFHYTPEEPVLQNLSLRIPYGEKLAIVGPNGCGKSTLVNLICRFYDPVEGAVRIDDVDLREVRQRELRRRIGIVTQQTVLFDDTVLSNIRYGSPHASDDEVMAAAQKAHAHRFIVEKLDQGYQTMVGERGGRLSGGQRQRIALARAILRDPEILILDEATSQIDLESEQLIHQALQEFSRGRTVIMITHRLSTLALADRILVMDSGQAIDVGTHQELLGRCDIYRRLHHIQFRESA